MRQVQTVFVRTNTVSTSRACGEFQMLTFVVQTLVQGSNFTRFYAHINGDFAKINGPRFKWTIHF